MKRNHLVGLASLALLATLPGCGNKLYPVQGQVLWEDGQPATELAGCKLYFECLEQHTVSRSTVKDDGSFELTTNRPEARGADGVPPGNHRVYLIAGPSQLAARYYRPDTSGLEVTVPPDGPVVLKLERNRNDKKDKQALSPQMQKQLE